MSFELELNDDEVNRIFKKRDIATKPGNATLELNDDEVNALLGARGYNLANEKRPTAAKFGKVSKSSNATKATKSIKTERPRENKTHLKPVGHQVQNKIEKKREHTDKKVEKVEKQDKIKHHTKSTVNKLIELTKESDYHALLKSNERVVLFFGSEGCPACQALHPLYERIANRYADKVQLAYADVDKYQISFRYVPVFQIYYRGEKKDEIIGASVEELKNFIAQAIKTK